MPGYTSRHPDLLDDDTMDHPGLLDDDTMDLRPVRARAKDRCRCERTRKPDCPCGPCGQPATAEDLLCDECRSPGGPHCHFGGEEPW